MYCSLGRVVYRGKTPLARNSNTFEFGEAGSSPVTSIKAYKFSRGKRPQRVDRLCWEIQVRVLSMSFL